MNPHAQPLSGNTKLRNYKKKSKNVFYNEKIPKDTSKILNHYEKKHDLTEVYLIFFKCLMMQYTIY